MAATLERVKHETQTQKQTGPSVRRRVSSAVLVPTAVLALALLTGALSPAAAAPTTWDEPDNPALAGVLLTLGGSIVGVIAVIALLVYLPSMMGRGGSGDLVYSDPEWFGGPRTGVKGAPEDSASETDAATTDIGGSGAQW